MLFKNILDVAADAAREQAERIIAFETADVTRH